jgi:hypothetical protein
MRRESRQKLGYLVTCLIVITSYFSGLYAVRPLVLYGPPFFYFSPVKILNDNIFVEKSRSNSYLFSNGEIRTKNIFTRVFTVSVTFFAFILVGCLMMLMYIFAFYVLGVDLAKLWHTGEYKRGERMTTWEDYVDTKADKDDKITRDGIE